MIDFDAKHKELYLEELKVILNNYINIKEAILNAENNLDRDRNIRLEQHFLDKIFILINNFDDRGGILSLLKILREILPYEYFVNICNYKFKDHETKSLQDILYREYKNEFINLVLDSEVKNEE